MFPELRQMKKSLSKVSTQISNSHQQASQIQCRKCIFFKQFETKMGLTHCFNSKKNESSESDSKKQPSQAQNQAQQEKLIFFRPVLDAIYDFVAKCFQKDRKRLESIFQSLKINILESLKEECFEKNQLFRKDIESLKLSIDQNFRNQIERYMFPFLHKVDSRNQEELSVFKQKEEDLDQKIASISRQFHQDFINIVYLQKQNEEKVRDKMNKIENFTIREFQHIKKEIEQFCITANDFNSEKSKFFEHTLFQFCESKSKMNQLSQLLKAEVQMQKKERRQSMESIKKQIQFELNYIHSSICQLKEMIEFKERDVLPKQFNRKNSRSQQQQSDEEWQTLIQKYI